MQHTGLAKQHFDLDKNLISKIHCIVLYTTCSGEDQLKRDISISSIYFAFC